MARGHFEWQTHCNATVEIASAVWHSQVVWCFSWMAITPCHIMGMMLITGCSGCEGIMCVERHLGDLGPDFCHIPLDTERAHGAGSSGIGWILHAAESCHQGPYLSGAPHGTAIFPRGCDSEIIRGIGCFQVANTGRLDLFSALSWLAEFAVGDPSPAIITTSA